VEYLAEEVELIGVAAHLDDRQRKKTSNFRSTSKSSWCLQRDYGSSWANIL